MIILTPFRYCGYKEVDADRELTDCGTFANVIFGGMPMCDRHEKTVRAALAGGDFELVRAPDQGDTLRGDETKQTPTEGVM